MLIYRVSARACPVKFCHKAPCPHYAGENAALFLRLGLPSTLIRHEKGACCKRSASRKKLKTPALRFCGRKTF